MNRPARIPLAMSVRWRYFRQILMPALFFMMTCGLVGYLWRQENTRPSLPGMVEASRVQVAVPISGQLVPLPHGTWTLFDAVEAGDVIARLDDSAVQASLNTLALERAKIELQQAAVAAEYEIQTAQLRQDQQQEAMRLMWQVEQLRLEVLDRKTQIAADRAELERIETQLSFVDQLGRSRTVAPMDVANLAGQREVVLQRIETAMNALREVEQQREFETRRLNRLEITLPNDVAQLVAPLRAALDVHEARVEEVQLKLSNLVVTAPITGTICEIHSWPGQSVQAGTPLVTIAADHGRYIVSYLRQEHDFDVRPDMPVAVRPQQQRVRPVATRVIRVGPQYEVIPEFQRTDPQVAERGLPVMLELPSQLKLRPGEVVEVFWSTSPADRPSSGP